MVLFSLIEYLGKLGITFENEINIPKLNILASNIIALLAFNKLLKSLI